MPLVVSRLFPTYWTPYISKGSVSFNSFMADLVIIDLTPRFSICGDYATSSERPPRPHISHLTTTPESIPGVYLRLLAATESLGILKTIVGTFHPHVKTIPVSFASFRTFQSLIWTFLPETSSPPPQHFQAVHPRRQHQAPQRNIFQPYESNP